MVTVYFPKPFGFSSCSYPYSFNSREDRNLASFGLSGDGHENTESNLLLARAGEGRICLRYSFSNFRFHVLIFFTRVKNFNGHFENVC